MCFDDALVQDDESRDELPGTQGDGKRASLQGFDAVDVWTRHTCERLGRFTSPRLLIFSLFGSASSFL